ncbi:MAG: FHA domain-containing protein [Deltaproteobacteria bacterium]|nr:FHA domain-containing protein [Deltaproteobacteria bacterium]
MDASSHYRQLIKLGREEFLAAAAPAVLVRFRGEASGSDGARTLTLDHDDEEPIDETLPMDGIGAFSVSDIDMAIHPLLKKPGASFPDRITIGRTSNNDIAISDHSISRLHAYVKVQGTTWVVADAGSKNGSWVRGEPLEARRERPIRSREVLRLGDVDLTFYLAPDLFHVLGGYL